MTAWGDDPELLATFRAEVEERLASLQAGLLALETSGAPRQVVHGLFRDAHTVKGSARMLGLGGVLRVAHAMEDLLGALRDGRAVVGSDLVSVLLEACDAIGRALPGGELDDGDLEPVVVALATALGGRAPAAVDLGGPGRRTTAVVVPPPAAVPAAPPLPVPAQPVPARTQSSQALPAQARATGRPAEPAPWSFAPAGPAAPAAAAPPAPVTVPSPVPAPAPAPSPPPVPVPPATVLRPGGDSVRVLMTSRGEDASRQAGLEAGASAYLLKTDFDQDQLVTTVRRLVGR